MNTLRMTWEQLQRYPRHKHNPELHAVSFTCLLAHQCAPTSEEIDQIQSFEGSKSELGEAEQFVLEVRANFNLSVSFLSIYELIVTFFLADVYNSTHQTET